MGLKSFPWPEVHHFGVVVLGLAPNDLWALTPKELAMLIGKSPSDPTDLRTSLMTLMNQFPDLDHD